MPTKKNDFGQLVRQLRLRTIHPQHGRELRQGEFAEAIGVELGRQNSYQAPTISNWENGNNRPANREVALALIRVGMQYKGLTFLAEANALLVAAEFNPLTTAEGETLLGAIAKRAEDTEEDKQGEESSPPPAVAPTDGGERRLAWLFLVGLAGIALVLVCIGVGVITALYLLSPNNDGTPLVGIAPPATAPATLVAATATMPPPTPTPVGWTEELTVSVGAITTAIVPDGARVQVAANGTIIVGNSIGAVDPAGRTSFTQGFLTLPIATSYNVDEDIPHGALLCRLETEIEWRACGRYLEFEAQSAGKLELRLNDNNTQDNSGAFNVRVTVQE